MSRSVRLLAATLAAAALAGPATQAPAAHAAACAEGYTTEDGSCAAPVPSVPLTAEQLSQRADKAAQVKAFVQAAHDKKAAGKPGPAATSQPGSLPAPDGGLYNFAMPEVSNMYIWKEGEGNGKKSYTCGPAATRNMVAAMWAHRYGNYQDYGEAQFASWEGTTTSGTSRANIAAALNNHFSQFGSWTTIRPSDKGQLLGLIAVDTRTYYQPVILNVDTEEYSWWNNKALDHFDFAYGFDNTGSTDYVKVAEEWDPIYIYGSSSYGNPYGRHPLTTLASAYRAVTKTSIHGIVS